MTLRGTLFQTIVRCLIFSTACSSLGLTCGCGGNVPSQIESDEEADGKMKSAFDAMKTARSKKRLPEVPKANTKKRPLGL